MSYGDYDWKNSQLYRGYDKQEQITVDELYELVMNMKINNADLEDGAVDYSKIKAASIGEVHIREAAINHAAIQIGAIGRAHIQQAAIGRAEIEDAAIDTAKIALG